MWMPQIYSNYNISVALLSDFKAAAIAFIFDDIVVDLRDKDLLDADFGIPKTKN